MRNYKLFITENYPEIKHGKGGTGFIKKENV
jgi:hypothetical protein